MSELKEYLCVEALDPYTKEIPGYLFICAKYRAPQAEMELVYLKSEADNVIAELKKQVHDYAQCLYVMQARGEKESRHQKYKRCLAMAEACMHKLWRTDEGFDYALRRKEDDRLQKADNQEEVILLPASSDRVVSEKEIRGETWKLRK